jgi:hypothetical protein
MKKDVCQKIVEESRWRSRNKTGEAIEICRERHTIFAIGEAIPMVLNNGNRRKRKIMAHVNCGNSIATPSERCQ